MDMYDIVIIGGGPAGMMAAISAKKHHPDYSVVIIDRTFEIGRKFLTAGAGRGNLTNINLETGPQGHYYGDQDFITSVFLQFGYTDIMKFFSEIGVSTYVELKTGKGKIFPEVDHAKTIRDLMVELIKEAGVTIVCNSTVVAIQKNGELLKIVTSTGEIEARSVILSAGGKTYPALGSDGSGYAIASSLGHTIIDPVVSAVPIVSKNILSHFLQGEKMNMQVTAILEGVEVSTAIGDVMFAQYGFSGPAVFDVSREFSIQINREHKSGCAVRLSFFPDETPATLLALLEKRWVAHPSFTVAASLWGLLTQKASGGVCAALQFPKEKIVAQLTPEEKQNLVKLLLSFESEVTGTRGWNEGEFTAGGVDTSEIDSQTMMSKKAKQVFLAGEILNVDGQVGGFNLSWAWATGWIAGKAV